jgi:hypothetical protein
MMHQFQGQSCGHLEIIPAHAYVPEANFDFLRHSLRVFAL